MDDRTMDARSHLVLGKGDMPDAAAVGEAFNDLVASSKRLVAVAKVLAWVAAALMVVVIGLALAYGLRERTLDDLETNSEKTSESAEKAATASKEAADILRDALNRSDSPDPAIQDALVKIDEIHAMLKAEQNP